MAGCCRGRPPSRGRRGMAADDLPRETPHHRSAAAMSHRATKWVARQRGLSLGERVVLWVLADHLNDGTGRCDPSQSRLRDACEISHAALNRYLRSLERRGLIRRVRRIDGASGGNRSTFYELALSGPFDPAGGEAEDRPPDGGGPGAGSGPSPGPSPGAASGTTLVPPEGQPSCRRRDTNREREPGKRTIPPTPSAAGRQNTETDHEPQRSCKPRRRSARPGKPAAGIGRDAWDAAVASIRSGGRGASADGGS